MKATWNKFPVSPQYVPLCEVTAVQGAEALPVLETAIRLWPKEDEQGWAAFKIGPGCH